MAEAIAIRLAQVFIIFVFVMGMISLATEVLYGNLPL